MAAVACWPLSDRKRFTQVMSVWERYDGFSRIMGEARIKELNKLEKFVSSCSKLLLNLKLSERGDYLLTIAISTWEVDVVKIFLRHGACPELSDRCFLQNPPHTVEILEALV